MKRELEHKAAEYVLKGRVNVEHVLFDTDGRITEAVGTVTNNQGQVWTVSINGTDTTCDCPYGEKRLDARGHSHDIAVRVAAKPTTKEN